MRSFERIKKGVQIFCDRVQLPRSTVQGCGDCLNEYPLDRDHLHFFGTLVDRTPDGANLEHQVGTVDLENLMLIQLRFDGLEPNGTLSNVMFNHDRKSMGCAMVGNPISA